MYVCIYVCMYVCVCVCVRARARACVCLCASVPVSLSLCVSVCVYLCIYVFVCVCLCVCVLVVTCMHVRSCVHARTCAARARSRVCIFDLRRSETIVFWAASRPSTAAWYHNPRTPHCSHSYKCSRPRCAAAIGHSPTTLLEPHGVLRNNC